MVASFSQGLVVKPIYLEKTTAKSVLQVFLPLEEGSLPSL